MTSVVNDNNHIKSCGHLVHFRCEIKHYFYNYANLFNKKIVEKTKKQQYNKKTAIFGGFYYEMFRDELTA